MKIYTKTGDTGMTSLFGGKRVGKDDLRIDCYGTVDELNSFIGLLHASIADDTLRSVLLDIQSRLFTVGSNLASDPDKEMITPDIVDQDIAKLESEIDRMDQHLAPLKHFIMPSGSQAIASAHVCRTVCRRSERLIIALSKVSVMDEMIIKYINRLSDYFFMVARYVAVGENIEEIPWQPKKTVNK
jgi:cob(I)alamin adenosyltransferase